MFNQYKGCPASPGLFSTCSAYEFLTVTPYVDTSYHLIGKIKTPFRVIIFTWLRWHNKLLTIENLIKERMDHAKYVFFMQSARNDASQVPGVLIHTIAQRLYFGYHARTIDNLLHHTEQLFYNQFSHLLKRTCTGSNCRLLKFSGTEGEAPAYIQR
jgi:zinc-binding in reverse transcriptase